MLSPPLHLIKPQFALRVIRGGSGRWGGKEKQKKTRLGSAVIRYPDSKEYYLERDTTSLPSPRSGDTRARLDNTTMIDIVLPAVITGTSLFQRPSRQCSANHRRLSHRHCCLGCSEYRRSDASRQTAPRGRARRPGLILSIIQPVLSAQCT